jgi:hypothetical protein
MSGAMRPGTCSAYQMTGEVEPEPKDVGQEAGGVPEEDLRGGEDGGQARTQQRHAGKEVDGQQHRP